MTTVVPDAEFWQSRFETGQTPWDRGAASPQFERWLAEGRLRPPASVLVPGCGSGYEVERLAAAGFDVTAVDYASSAVARVRGRLALAGLPGEVVLADLLDWMPSRRYDAVYEQTCLCAMHPSAWTAYAARMAAWVVPGGRLFALFMQALRPAAANGVLVGPPYHCDIGAMRALFPDARWRWPEAPYARVSHPAGWEELAVVLERRPD